MINVVIHTSASGFGNAALISKWHLERGWTGIGYHYVVLNGHLSSTIYHDEFNGHIETGRPLDDDPFISKKEMGAHVRGFNRNSVGICLIGNGGDHTPEQLRSALKCAYMLEKQFGEIDLFQHSDLDENKPDCAGLDMDQFEQDYKRYRKEQVAE